MTSKANSITMQPKNYADHYKKIQYPCSAQVKLNGMHAVARWEDGEIVLRFRSNNVVTTLPHLNEAVESILPNDKVLDCELYNSDLSFDELSSLIKSTVNRKDTTAVQLHVFDTISIDCFNDRWRAVEEIVSEDTTGLIFIVDNLHIVNATMLDNFYNTMVELGHEGIVVRDINVPYILGKTDKSLKRKPSKEDEFEIIGLNEGKGKDKGHIGAFVCVTKDGETFKAKMSGKQQTLKELFDAPDGLIGSMLTVKYYEITKRGVPLNPVGKAIRYDLCPA